MLRVLMSFVLSLAVLGCQTKTIDPGEARAALLRGLDIDPSTVVYQDHARYAVAAGSARTAAFRSGLYVQTASELHLLRQKDGKVFERDISLPLSKLLSATLESWTFTHLKQLQVRAPSGLIVINFHDQPDAIAGDGESAEAAHAALLKANVRAGTRTGRVWPEEAVKPYNEVYPVTVK